MPVEGAGRMSVSPVVSHPCLQPSVWTGSLSTNHQISSCLLQHHRTRLVCENERLRLVCKNETVLTIYSAINTNCFTSICIYKLFRRCHGRTNCSVLADTLTFGDPCFPGTRKHLRVSFTCGFLAAFDWRVSSVPSHLQVDGILAPPTGHKMCSLPTVWR
uniref:Uncharacterized protein n=1 Tax=Takifugu rubripes TaxID=31033 RepID=H2TG17_TAKRU